ncbi:uncharacterized protein LOC119446730 isoform X2 [Dermacentor silvarum]|uniref:uncharacterized protein LOC119446730 isoform X2 n=1 Tax=Dermacentor silvarum TaxID=543639 RepID=UPI002100CD37|nr:uncharacterized protein LOC119446730 isoform X2 [Dermacentor silvarum]
MRRLRTKVRGPAPAKGRTRTGPRQDTAASPRSNLAAAMTIPAESTVSLTPQVNKQHGTPDVGPVPERIMQLCKSITNEQLVSKLRSKHRHGSSDIVTAINEAGSQMSLPGFPRSDTVDILSFVLPFLLASQQPNEKFSSKKGNEVLSFRKTIAKKQDISSEMHSLAAENKGSTTSVDPRLRTEHKRIGRPHSCSPQFPRVQKTLAANVRAALSRDTAVVAPVRNLVVELDRLTAEEISAFTSHRHRSPVKNRTAQESKDVGCRSQATEWPTPVHVTRTSGPGQSQKQPSVHSHCLRDTADSKSDAMDIEGPALHKQPLQDDSQLSDQDEDSPSLLESMPSGCLRSLPSSSQTSSEVTFKKRLSVRFANLVHKETADWPANKQLLPAPTASEKTSQVRCHIPLPLDVGDSVDPRLSKAGGSSSQDSPRGTERHIIRSVSPDALPPPLTGLPTTADWPADKQLPPAPTASEKTSQVRCHIPLPLDVADSVDPPLSKAGGSGSQDSPRGTERHISRSVSPDALSPPKKHRVRFTALQEEALVYGVMKYGRGSWKEISDDGLFDGRRTIDLHDKYRNLEKYGHLPNVKRRVKDMLSAGVNPLKKLRALCKQQQAASLTHGEGNSVSQPKETQRALPSLRGPERASAAPSSDNASLEPFQNRTQAQNATSLLDTARSSSDGPSASQAHPVALAGWSSDTESNVSQESVPTKFKEKRRRVPFTPLEEEALVAGVLKFGKGNWVRILTEGGFLGRTGTQLSDKYRNLKLYRQLEAVEKAVKTRRARGEDPLEELRKLSAAHWKR